MHLSPSTLLGFALNILALTTTATTAQELAPNHQTKRQANTQSVSTAEFKSRFEQSGIVPEVIAALDPSVSFYATYKTITGNDALLVPGSSLTVSEAVLPFEFSVENLANATGVTAQTRFLIYLLDADAPSRDNPSARNLRHYLAGNYTLSTLTSSIIPGAQRLFLSSQRAFPFTEFTQPSPAPNTGVHRFIYALYVQPDTFLNANFDSVGMETETSNWDLAAWRMQLGLGPAIGATFFTIDTDVNNGAGVSGQLNVAADGQGLAAGRSMASAWGVLAAVFGVLGFLM